MREPEGINLEGLDSDSDEDIDNDNKKPLGNVDVEYPPEERYKVLIRQVNMRLQTFGASSQTAAAAAVAPTSNSVPMSKLLSLATKGERCILYLAWSCSTITGLVLPSFIFLLGPVFDAFGPEQSKDESLEQVQLVVIIMGVLAFIVFLASYLAHYLQEKGSLIVVKSIKSAYFKAVLE